MQIQAQAHAPFPSTHNSNSVPSLGPGPGMGGEFEPKSLSGSGSNSIFLQHGLSLDPGPPVLGSESPANVTPQSHGTKSCVLSIVRLANQLPGNRSQPLVQVQMLGV